MKYEPTVNPNFHNPNSTPTPLLQSAMEFPFGQKHHHNHNEEEDRNNPHYPPPGTHQISHQNPAMQYHAYPPVTSFNDPPTPFPTGSVHYKANLPGPSFPLPPSSAEDPVRHVSHQIPYRNGPPYAGHVFHPSWDSGALSLMRTVRIYTKAEENYSLSIRDGKVVLELKNHEDIRQHWIKDLKYSTKIKDEEGFPAFALVNKATGEAVKHSVGATKPVSLVPYNPDVPDESVLWSESKDLGDGFRCIRMINNISLNFDAFNGDEQHGGVHDGTYIVLWEWLKGKNQRWKIVPY